MQLNSSLHLCTVCLNVVFSYLLFMPSVYLVTGGVRISGALIGALALTSRALFDNTEAAGRAFVFSLSAYSNTTRRDFITFRRKRYV